VVTLFDDADNDGALEVGETVLGTDTVAGGVFSIDVDLAEGEHHMRAFQTDAAGNVSAASAALTITVDTSAPPVPGAPDLAAGSDSGASITDNVTNVTTPIFTGTGAVGSTIRLKEGSSLLGTGIVDGSGNWSITSSALGAGDHTIIATSIDDAGNESGFATGITVTIDIAPALAFDLSADTDTGAVGNKVTTLDTVTLVGTTEAFATVRLLDRETQADDSGVFSFSGVALSVGDNLILVEAEDDAGNITQLSQTNYVNFNGHIFFGAAGSVYKIDGGSGAITMVIEEALGGSSSSTPELYVFEDGLYAKVDSEGNARTFALIDGDLAVPLNIELAHGSGSSSPGGFVKFGDRIGFIADTVSGENQLLAVEPGSAAVSNLDPIEHSPYGYLDVAGAGGDLYAIKQIGYEERILIRVDEAGTVFEVDVPVAGGFDTIRSTLGEANGDLYFTVLSSSGTWFLNRIDGETGTITEVATGGGLLFNSIKAVDDKLVANTTIYVSIIDPSTSSASIIFSPDSGAGILGTGIVGEDIYISDSVSPLIKYEGGTGDIINVELGYDTPIAVEFTNFDGDLYFVATTNLGRELVRIDGASGEVEIYDSIRPGETAALNPGSLRVFDGDLYFRGSDASLGVELFRLDGDSGAIELVADISSGSSGSSPQNLTAFQGVLLFTANDGVHGTELFEYDPVTDQVTLIADIGSASSSPSELTVIDGILYFRAQGSRGIELFSYDGTSVTEYDVNPFAYNYNPVSIAAVETGLVL